jgi:hypothetical protein
MLYMPSAEQSQGGELRIGLPSTGSAIATPKVETPSIMRPTMLKNGRGDTGEASLPDRPSAPLLAWPTRGRHSLALYSVGVRLLM